MGTKAKRYKKILRNGYRIIKTPFWLLKSKKQNKELFENVTTVA